MPIGKPIADLGDTGDADQKISGGLPPPSSPSGFGAVTPSFGSVAVNNFATAPTVPTSHAPDRTAGAAEAVKGGAESTIENTNTDWINKKWRPVMGWIYMLTCTMDFVIFPILWSLLQALSKGAVTSQWQPLTLQGAGLYHIAMGAVLGIAAYGRTKEKVEGKA